MFFESRLAKWAADPAAMGIDPALLAQLQSETAAARAAFRAKVAAISAARAAALAERIAVKKMLRTGAGVIAQVGTKSRSAGNGVFALASLPVPNKRRSPLGPPGKPESITAELQPIGWLRLRWTCKNPRGSVGTMYRVYRRTEPNGPFQLVGMSGTRQFIDKTVPAGTGVVEYQVQATRSTAVGPAANQQIYLGVSGSSGGGSPAGRGTMLADVQLRRPRRSRKRRAA
jgi:hypothetical protein